MGQWVTVKLAYGFDLGEGIPSFLVVNEDNDNDGDVANFWEEWCAFQKGMKQPDYQDKIAWEAYKQAYLDFENENPFEILTYHSYGSYARYFLALSESVQTGYSEKPMIPNMYDISPNIFKDFCEKYKVPYQEPKWQIVSLYG